MTVQDIRREFSASAAKAAGDKAVDRAGSNADDEWKDVAYTAITQICRKLEYFTTDPIWYTLGASKVEAPHEPRAIGAMLRSAASDGWCEPTDRYVSSERVACHGRPVRVWRSLRVEKKL